MEKDRKEKSPWVKIKGSLAVSTRSKEIRPAMALTEMDKDSWFRQSSLLAFDRQPLSFAASCLSRF